MPRRKIQHILDDLQQEIRGGAALSSGDLEMLTELISNVRDVADEDAASDDLSVLESLNETAARFESTHPRLTKALVSVSELLHSIGIS